MTLPEITVQPSLKKHLARGHPWIYRNQVSSGGGLPSGAWVRVRCGGFSAVGLWDEDSQIAVRIFSRDDAPDKDWFHERVWDAWDARAPLRATNITAYRWIFGEGDGLPGIVVDRYGDYAIVQPYAASAATLVPQIAHALRACDPDLRGVVLKERAGADDDPVADAPAGQQQQTALTLVWGELPPAELVIQEHGLYMHADLRQGQKTGLFLDQRENRRTVEQWAMGRQVLNCFAYTGGFSLYALRGGAAHVVSADIGRGLDAAATANFALNGIDSAQHSFVTDNCFALLDTYAKQGRCFDMVILDPPSFAKTKANVYAAVRAYVRLNALALRCIEPGGLLVSASCTSQVSPEAFRDILADAGMQAQRRIQILHEAGHALDHPVPAGFLEGRYLKFIVGRVLPLA